MESLAQKLLHFPFKLYLREAILAFRAYGAVFYFIDENNGDGRLQYGQSTYTIEVAVNLKRETHTACSYDN